MNLIQLIYLIGCVIAFIYLVLQVKKDNHNGKIVLYQFLAAMVMSLFSWVTLIVALIIVNAEEELF